MTGSSGPKVGSTVAAHLSQQHAVLGLEIAPAKFTRYVADITLFGENDWQPLLEGVNAVVHFAALHAPQRESHSRSEFTRTNVDATRRLVSVANQCGVRRFLLASITSVYGESMRNAGGYCRHQLTAYT